MASHRQRRHPELFRQGQRRHQAIHRAPGVRWLGARGDLAQQLERPRLVSARSVSATHVERRLGVPACVGDTAGLGSSSNAPTPVKTGGWSKGSGDILLIGKHAVPALNAYALKESKETNNCAASFSQLQVTRDSLAAELPFTGAPFGGCSASGTAHAENDGQNSRRRAHMVGVLVLAVAGVVAWKYRDSLGEYLKGNAAPTREKVDDLLRTAQVKSETFMDSAKERISSGFGSARQKIHRPATEPNRESPTE